MLRLVKCLKIDSEEVERGRCIGGSNASCLGEKERHNVWKDYIERVMNEEMIVIKMWKVMQ